MRPLDPLAPIVTDTPTDNDRSFYAVLRYELQAGSRSVPLGGRPSEGGGRIGEYIGGYSDWLRQRSAAAPAELARPQAAPAASATPTAPKPKLSFKVQRELDELPQRIAALEAQLTGFTARMAEPGYFQRDAAAVTADNVAMAAAQADLDAAYARWEELEGG